MFTKYIYFPEDLNEHLFLFYTIFMHKDMKKITYFYSIYKKYFLPFIFPE